MARLLEHRMKDRVYNFFCWVVFAGAMLLWFGAVYVVAHFVIKYW